MMGFFNPSQQEMVWMDHFQETPENYKGRHFHLT